MSVATIVALYLGAVVLIILGFVIGQQEARIKHLEDEVNPLFRSTRFKNWIEDETVTGVRTLRELQDLKAAADNLSVRVAGAIAASERESEVRAELISDLRGGQYHKDQPAKVREEVSIDA